MAWKTIDRNKLVVERDAAPVLNEEVRNRIRSFFHRYETKQAALLPALHVAQNALGRVSLAAQVEIAELLGLKPSQVFDTVGFYTHFWTHPKGRKVIVVCRSISCECMGGEAVLAAFKKTLGIDEHETTPDGEFSLMTEECLAGCDDAPCVLIGERLHQRVKPEDVPRLLADADNDQLDVPRSDLFDAPRPGHKPAARANDSGVATGGRG